MIASMATRKGEWRRAMQLCRYRHVSSNTCEVGLEKSGPRFTYHLHKYMILSTPETLKTLGKLEISDLVLNETPQFPS